MRIHTMLALLNGLYLSSSLTYATPADVAASDDDLDSNLAIASDPPNAAPVSNPDEPVDGRRYWYCNAAPARWAGNWTGRDYEAFGRDYERVHHLAESRCERFHRTCIVWCERRHAWEWDGGIPEPDRG